MNRWKLALPVVALVFSSLGAVGCVVREVEVEHAPPAERQEVVAPAPSREHVWVKGRWRWDGDGYRWQPGHWETRRVGYEWQPGHWERTRRGWTWREGVWVRR